VFFLFFCAAEQMLLDATRTR